MLSFLSILLIKERVLLVKHSQKGSFEIVVMVLLLLVAVAWAVLDGYHLAIRGLDKNYIPFLVPFVLVIVDAMVAWMEFR